MFFVMAKYHYDRHGNYTGKTSDSPPGFGGAVSAILLGGIVLCVVYPAIPIVIAIAAVAWLVWKDCSGND
jgi:hypothetical protein